MGSDDNSKVVGDYVTLVRGTTYKGALVGKPGPALLGLGSIEPGGGFRIGHYKTYGGECPDDLMLFPGDLYVSLKGATKDGDMIGSVARVPPSIRCGRLTQDTVKLVFRAPNSEDPSYLHWILRTPQYRHYCAGRAMGSAVVALSRRDFLSYPVPSPTILRRKVVALLDTIEEKIEINRRMSETLQTMSRSLFKSWFVDFDPVRAKAEGRDPGLSKPLADLFPARLVESDLGEIPEGFNVKAIGDMAEVVGGSTPSTAEPLYWEQGIHHWATPKDLSGLSVPVLIETERKITDAGLAQIGSGVLPTGTVLLSSRAPIGYLAIAEVPVAINQGFIAMKPRRGVSNLFLLLWAGVAHDKIVSHANGSTFLEISKANFRPIRVVAPSGSIMEAFERLVSPFYRDIVVRERECRTLGALRDTLLPDLISGKLTVKDPGGIEGATDEPQP
jgi:restriction endonuclease S subunit